jgi:hypothetical protein
VSSRPTIIVIASPFKIFQLLQKLVGVHDDRVFVFSYKIHKVRPESNDILLATNPCGNNRWTHFPDSLRYTNNDKTNAMNGHKYSIPT